MLDYRDGQYIGKKFKEFYNICPSDYTKRIICVEGVSKAQKRPQYKSKLATLVKYT